MTRPRTALVGRAAELAQLVAVLDTAARGDAGAVVVGGDAGVGKTRLLRELTDAAAERGFCTLIGHCVDLGDAPPPYLPFGEAFARLQSTDPELVAELAAEQPAIGRLLPGRGGAESDGRVERGTLFESVLGALAALARRTPVLLLIEDLHWADQATRDLLGFLLTRLGGERLAVIASFRADDLHRRHPLRRVLAEWSRLPRVTRIQLDRLPADDVRQLVGLLRAGPLAEVDVASIVSRADGNAFFVEELVAATEQYTDAQQLPWQLADLLLVRLDRLSDDARAVVRVASVGGRRVSHAMLAEVVGLAPERLDAALRDAIDAHVLETTSSGLAYTFRHALLAEAVYDDLLPGERVRLHTAYAALLRQDVERSRAELARHAFASHDLVTAYEASVAAGDEAMALAAPQDALQHYELAYELAPRAGVAPADPADLVLAIVEAAEGAGRWQRGLDLARAAIRTLPPDAPDLVRAKLLYGAVRATLSGEIDQDTLAESAEAVRLTPSEPPTRLLALMLAQRSRVVRMMGMEVDGERLAREALRVARVVGDPAVVAEAEMTLAMFERLVGDRDEAARLLEEVAARARAAGDHGTEMRSRFSLASQRHDTGDLPAALEDFDWIVRRAAELGRPWEAFAVVARSMSGLVHYTSGDWDAARAAVRHEGDRPPELAAAVLESVDLQVRAGRGDLAAADLALALRPYWVREGRIALYSVMAALEVYEQTGDVEAARRVLDDLVAVLTRIWLTEWNLVRVELSARLLAVLNTAAAHASAADHAQLAATGARYAQDARTTVERAVPPGRQLGPEGLAWLQRLDAEQARLRWLTGVDPPPAEELVGLWRRSVELFDYGNLRQVTTSRARLAAVLRAVGRPGEAAEQARLALPAARSMGAGPLVAELAALAGGRDSAAGKDGRQARGGLGALTDRERDVLALVVQGRSNRQIAAQLYITAKTASVHVSNIMAKLGVRSRGEAAAVARGMTGSAGVTDADR
ncbi:AAA family ATPase [uncultured Jatrophihabitans sp.]|uniref:ATP-binding protein n=1 Tax=uncultured Jatrophihabitans sp. TaxID=1610747 RepID=UPI0035CB7062